jgi:hypothetical protein
MIKTVWIYEVGRVNMKVFATAEAAQAWFDENDPEGVAFEYPVETKSLDHLCR